MFHERIINKVPGQVNTKVKSDYVQDVSTMSLPVLLESLERQKKLMSNRSFINKLPDKGIRIETFKHHLEEEIKRRETTSELCEVMSGLTINGKELSDALEWEGKCNPGIIKSESSNVDHEIRDEDPFQILVSHSSSTNNKKEIRVERAPESLIKASDLEDIHVSPNDDLYVVNLCNRMHKGQIKEKFLPHKTLKTKENDKESNNLNQPEEESSRNKCKVELQLLSLEESIKVQIEQERHFKEVQMKHATERLHDKHILIGEKLPTAETLFTYREVPGCNSDDEVDDECEPEDKDGCVTYTITG